MPRNRQPAVHQGDHLQDKEAEMMNISIRNILLGNRRKKEPVLLAITPPRSGERTLLGVENLLASIAVPEPFSLELAGDSAGVTLFDCQGRLTGPPWYSPRRAWRSWFWLVTASSLVASTGPLCRKPAMMVVVVDYLLAVFVLIVVAAVADLLSVAIPVDGIGHGVGDWRVGLHPAHDSWIPADRYAILEIAPFACPSHPAQDAMRPGWCSAGPVSQS